MSAHFKRLFNGFKNDHKLIGGTIGYFVALYLTVEHVVFVTCCIGPSMVPTIDERGDYAFVDVWNYKHGLLGTKKKYLRGDIVIAKAPYDQDKTICKRILATEGDVVLNNLNYPHIQMKIVPKGYVWLSGDNPKNSNDSRYYGVVPVGLIRGRIFMKNDHSDDLSSMFNFREVLPNQDYKSDDNTAAVLIDAADNPSLCEGAMKALPAQVHDKIFPYLAEIRPEHVYVSKVKEQEAKHIELLKSLGFIIIRDDEDDDVDDIKDKSRNNSDTSRNNSDSIKNSDNNSSSSSSSLGSDDVGGSKQGGNSDSQSKRI